MNIPFITHDCGTGYRAIMPTQSGKFELSLVAGRYFYSSPREDLSTPNYDAVELAVFNATTKEWASYNEMKSSGAFDILEGEGEYSNESDGDKPQMSVFGWVGIDKIEKLIQAL